MHHAVMCYLLLNAGICEILRFGFYLSLAVLFRFCFFVAILKTYILWRVLINCCLFWSTLTVYIPFCVIGVCVFPAVFNVFFAFVIINCYYTAASTTFIIVAAAVVTIYYVYIRA